LGKVEIVAVHLLAIAGGHVDVGTVGIGGRGDGLGLGHGRHETSGGPTGATCSAGGHDHEGVSGGGEKGSGGGGDGYG